MLRSSNCSFGRHCERLPRERAGKKFRSTVTKVCPTNSTWQMLFLQIHTDIQTRKTMDDANRLSTRVTVQLFSACHTTCAGTAKASARLTSPEGHQQETKRFNIISMYLASCDTTRRSPLISALGSRSLAEPWSLSELLSPSIFDSSRQ